MEVVVVVALLGLVTAAVSGSLWFGLRSTQDNTTLLDQSMASQAISRYLNVDIYASEGVTTAAVCGTADLKLVSRSDAASTGATDVVTAWQWTSAARTVERRICVNGATRSTQTVARNIDQFTVTANADKSFTVTYRAAASGRLAAVSRSVKIEPVISREAP